MRREHLCIIKVYLALDPGCEEQNKQSKRIFPLPVADIFDKSLTIGGGQAPVKKYNEYLRDLIISGRANPGKIVSHHIHIDDVPKAYERFDQRIDGYTKVLIRFADSPVAAAAD